MDFGTGGDGELDSVGVGEPPHQVAQATIARAAEKIEAAEDAAASGKDNTISLADEALTFNAQRLAAAAADMDKGKVATAKKRKATSADAAEPEPVAYLTLKGDSSRAPRGRDREREREREAGREKEGRLALWISREGSIDLGALGMSRDPTQGSLGIPKREGPRHH